jgi:tetratricopeptide (TPR) repeat protein/predicted Ser/Thr protein kinase
MSSHDPTLPGDDQTLPLDPDATLAADPTATSAGPVLPERVGHYRPLRVLGQGGMGVVYEAEQEKPRRLVALKVIRPEMATADLRRRFAHESDFLGRLQHPGIAQIYEAGTAETPAGPLPFMAMELVEGVTLNQWVQDQQPDRRTRLEVMIRLCDAVQHAHQRGIIHRDLKPGNVLVDAQGQPKVLDFGVARPADTDFMSTLLTTHGQLVGTIAYMSPEQLAGDPDDLDTRSDVFALGVILYQLLVERPPLDLIQRPLEEALRAIREEEPTPLSRHDASLDGDLTVIASMAMAKDRDQRYASANGLAMDLKRHLEDQPIAARPPGTMYLARKFARRHRPLVIGAVGVALALVLGVVGSTWQAVRATRAESLAENRLAQAETVTGFLQDMLAAVQPMEAKGQDVTVKEVLDRAAADLDGGSLAEQPAVESALRHTLGTTFRSLAELEESERHLTRAAALADSVLDHDDPVRLGITLDLATTIVQRGDIIRGEELVQEVRAAAPPESELEGDALVRLADIRYTQGHWAEADSIHATRQAMALRQAPDDSLRLASILIDRAFMAEQGNDYTRAEAMTNRALAIYLEEYGPSDPRLIKLHNKQGDIAKELWLLPAALEYHQQAMAIADSVFAPDHITRADILWRMGEAQRGVQDLDGAQDSYHEALRIRRLALGPVHRDIALVLVSLGSLAQNRGQMDLAEEYFLEALEMRREVFGEFHSSVAATLHDLGNMERARKDFDAALAYFRQAEELLEIIPEATGSMPANNAFFIAMSYQGLRQHEEAEVHFRRELEWTSTHFTPPHLKIAYSLGNVGGSIFRQGSKSEAADYFVQALDMFRELEVQGLGLMQAVGNAAFLLDDAERFAEAEPLHQEYIALAGELEGAQSPGQTNARARYFENLAHQGKWAEAEQQAQAIVAWREEHLPDEDYQRESSWLFLARAQVGQGRLTEAEENLARVEEALAGRDDLPAIVTDRMQELREALGTNR